MSYLLKLLVLAFAAAIVSAQPVQMPLECDESQFVRAGLSCGESRPCAVFLEWIDSAATKDAIVLAGATFTRESTLASLLAASFDGGKTWKEVFPRIGAASIEFVQFADKDNGWAVGQQLDQNGSFLPFVLLTIDGGKKWRRRNLWDPDEFRSGLILDMSFRSAERGELLIERGANATDPYERYETRNGGRVWSLREIANKRPRLTTPVHDPETSKWRVSTGASGDYDLQSEDGGEWSVVQSFAADLGECSAVEATKPFTP